MFVLLVSKSHRDSYGYMATYPAFPGGRSPKMFICALVNNEDKINKGEHRSKSAAPTTSQVITGNT